MEGAWWMLYDVKKKLYRLTKFNFLSKLSLLIRFSDYQNADLRYVLLISCYLVYFLNFLS